VVVFVCEKFVGLISIYNPNETSANDELRDVVPEPIVGPKHSTKPIAPQGEMRRNIKSMLKTSGRAHKLGHNATLWEVQKNIENP